MKISKRTLAILKNFATINQSIVVKPGSELQTISNLKDIFASANVEEVFEREFAIYDLNEFLGTVSLFEDPDFNFEEKEVIISEGQNIQRYMYADSSVITQVPDKGISLPSNDIDGKLTKEQLNKLIRAAAVNNATDMSFIDGTVKVHDKTTPNSNSFVIGNIADTSNTYNLSISVEKLKMVADDYNVNLCARGLAKFTGDQGIKYFIALQPDGSYGA